MDKFSINDWLTIQTRKDLTYIQRSHERETTNYAIFADLFIAVFSFVLDHILWTVVDSESGTVEQATPSWYWILTAALLILIPAVIFLIDWIKRKKYQKDTKKVIPVDQLIDLFDNEICYNAMTADSMRDCLLNAGEDVEDEIERFYYIEASYYSNKAATQLFYFKNQGKRAIKTKDSVEGISYLRFKNVCEIIYNIYKQLIDFADSKPGYEILLLDNKKYIGNFKNLMSYMGRTIQPELDEMGKWTEELKIDYKQNPEKEE